MTFRMYKSELLRLAKNTYDTMDYWDLLDAYTSEFPDEPIERDNLIDYIANNFIQLNNIKVMED